VKPKIVRTIEGLRRETAKWRNDDLTSITGGPRLKAESITAYVTPWGALNVAGVDDSGETQVYWWTPGMTKWIASPHSNASAGARNCAAPTTRR